MSSSSSLCHQIDCKFAAPVKSDQVLGKKGGNNKVMKITMNMQLMMMKMMMKMVMKMVMAMTMRFHLFQGRAWHSELPDVAGVPDHQTRPCHPCHHRFHLPCHD